MTRCPNGHESTTDDYCDTCGILIGGPGAASAISAGNAAPVAGTAPAAATTPTGTVTPEVEAGDCSNCGAARVGGERFCEVCGLDFETGKMPVAPQTAAAPAAPAEGQPLGSVVPSPPGIGWTAVVTADRDWWEHNTGAGGVADGVPFPDPVPPARRIELRQDRNLIGRTSGSSVADVDCGGADTGVSRKHATVTRTTDGSWTITDLGSTNGTFVGDANTKLAPQAETALEVGSAIKIGAYTVIHLEQDVT